MANTSEVQSIALPIDLRQCGYAYQRADVFAAGDCTEAADFSTGAHFVNAIQPDAADQSLVAALNMAGQGT